MKAKVIILLVVCAVVTLSFTVTNSNKKSAKTAEVNTAEATGPAGGMVSEDPFK